MKALCANKTVVEAVLRSMQEEGRVAKLKGFEQARLLFETFTVAFLAVPHSQQGGCVAELKGSEQVRSWV